MEEATHAVDRESAAAPSCDSAEQTPRTRRSKRKCFTSSFNKLILDDSDNSTHEGALRGVSAAKRSRCAALPARSIASHPRATRTPSHGPAVASTSHALPLEPSDVTILQAHPASGSSGGRPRLSSDDSSSRSQESAATVREYPSGPLLTDTTAPTPGTSATIEEILHVATVPEAPASGTLASAHPSPTADAVPATSVPATATPVTPVTPVLATTAASATIVEAVHGATVLEANTSGSLAQSHSLDSADATSASSYNPGSTPEGYSSLYNSGLSPSEVAQLHHVIESHHQRTNPGGSPQPLRQLGKLQAALFTQEFVRLAKIIYANTTTPGGNIIAVNQAVALLLNLPKRFALLQDIKNHRNTHWANSLSGQSPIEAERVHRGKKTAQAVRDGKSQLATRTLREGVPTRRPHLSPEQIQKLGFLHPRAINPEQSTPPPANPSDIRTQPKIESAIVSKALSRMRSNRAAGPSGWTNELLHLIARDAAGKLALTLWVRSVATGNLNISSQLAQCTLFALPKKGRPAGDVRPIAIGEPLLLIVSRVMALININIQAKRLALKGQFGLSSEGTAAAAMHLVTQIVQARSEGKENIAIVSLDLHNAFNTGFRKHIMGVAKAKNPNTYAFIYQLYRNPARLTMDSSGARLTSQAGVKQGDPLSSALFCEAFQEARDLYLSVLGQACVAAAGYADDDKIAINLDLISPEEALAKISIVLAKFGWILNPDKCEIHYLKEKGGTILFGIPFGSKAYCQQVVSDVLDRSSADADLASHYLSADTQAQCLQYFLSMYSRSQVQHMLRYVPPSHLPPEEVWEAWWQGQDNHMRAAIGLSRQQWRSLHPHLSPNAGGLSWRPPVSSYADGLASITRVLAKAGHSIPTGPNRQGLQDLLQQYETPDSQTAEASSSSSPSGPKEPPTASLPTGPSSRKPFSGLGSAFSNVAFAIPAEHFQAAIRLHLRGGSVPRYGNLVKTKVAAVALGLPDLVKDGGHWIDPWISPAVARRHVAKLAKRRSPWGSSLLASSFFADIGKLLWENDG